ncbi:DivIVA domain-containing protein [Cumulibacter manganitolerans]|uniref:DivIVA domain-containing protein n=1 Tax=Cumulibacter manganitolerans TaxID=1884992 RepID=UPI0018862082|nr:DivIVA domain-containing protein [Cumulibacter manganitolerans]
MKVSVAVLTFVLVVLGIVAVAVALYFAATLIFGPGEPPQPAGEPLASPLPAGRDLRAEDLRAATFPVTVRGYRMADVDALLERLAAQLAARDDAVAQDDAAADEEPPRQP